MGYELEYEWNKEKIIAYMKLHSVTIGKAVTSSAMMRFGIMCSSGEPDDTMYLNSAYAVYDKKGGTLLSTGSINIPFDIETKENIYKFVYLKIKELNPDFKDAREV